MRNKSFLAYFNKKQRHCKFLTASVYVKQFFENELIKTSEIVTDADS